MRIHKPALNVVIISALVALLALVLSVLGLGMKYQHGAEATIAYLPLFLAILAAVVVSFLFGWLRYSLNGGLSLAFAVLHDQVLSLALCAILSLVFGLSAYTPAFLLAGLAATYCFTLPFLRAARKLVRANNSRDFTRQMAAEQALRLVKALFILTAAAALLLLVAFLLSGNLAMAGNVLPLLTGWLAAALSARLLTPHVWAALPARRIARK